MQKIKQKLSFENGYILVTTLVFAFIATIAITGLIAYLGSLIKSSKFVTAREQAFQIAESGIDYYRWHLSHAPGDYKDGNATSTGPYTHDFFDKDGNKIGKFILSITPPNIGSTIVTVTSVGMLYPTSTISRSITAKLAIPSFAKYSVVANDNMRFGTGTEVFGPIHSNQGIRFDGLTHNIITSSQTSYDDPDHTDTNQEFAVHTHINAPPSSGINDTFRPLEAPPNPVPSRTDVFIAGRQFPFPTVDFNGITSDLSQMKADAQASGRYFAASGAQGYRIVLKTNDTFDIFRVTSLVNTPSNCTNSLSQTGWGTWSVSNGTLIGNFTFPTNGIIFVEDHVWVEGQINSARISIAAARFPDSPATRRSIIVNNDLLYTNYDGQDVVALVAQDNIHVGMISDTDLRIDAALMAQNGRVGRYYYKPNSNFPSSGGQARCSPHHLKTRITLFGMIGTNTRYGFAYTDNTGYGIRSITYDANLLYGPPPSFPLTSDQYQIIFWGENR